MKIIIIGSGKVGYTLAENLVKEKFDVIVIDKNHYALERIENNLDVMCIKGNGVSTGILLEAGVDTADLLIAVTESDEINMVCCLTAKKLGVLKTIARIRDPEYAAELSILKEQLGLNLVINPEQAAAEEIANSISFSSAINIESFAKGMVKMIDLKATADMNIVGKTIQKIDRETNSSVLIGVIVRAGKVIVPKGDFIIENNDDMYIIGKHSCIYNFCKHYNREPQKIKKVMIVGGGRISYYLSKALNEMGVKVKIIEKNRERCEELSELLPEILVINEDGTDEEILLSENIGDMDGFIAVTGMDEENLMSSLIAKRSGVKKVITKISRTNYINIVKEIGLDSIISPKLIITNHILRYVKGKKLDAFLRLIDGQAEILEFVIKDDNRILNKPIKDLNIPKNVIIATIVRKNEVVVPHGRDMFKKGDRIVVISMGKNITSLDELCITTPGGAHNEFFNGIKKLGSLINM